MEPASEGFNGFPQLLEEAKKTPWKEIRFDQADYLEFVIPTEHLSKVQAVLELFFGKPTKRPGEPLPEEIRDSMEKFGGVRNDQYLYLLEKDGSINYAMLWPWGDRESITVKIFTLPTNPFQKA